MHMWIYEIL